MHQPKVHYGNPPELNGIVRLTWCGLWQQSKTYDITDDLAAVTCSTCLKSHALRDVTKEAA